MSLEYAVITSKKDTAGRNIKEALEKFGSKVYEFDKDIVNLEDIDEEESIKDAELIIFASRHYSGEGRKNFCVHSIGNWKKADYGGKDGTLVKTSALMIKEMSIILQRNAEEAKSKGIIDKEYEFSLEATHHGPYIEKPCMFVEVGGTEKEWSDLKAIEVLARSIKEFITGYDEHRDNNENNNYKPAIAVGGLHYCQSFNRIQLSSKYAISFIAPKYALPLNKELIEQAIEKTSEKISTVIIDYKGLGNAEMRDKTITLLRECGLEIIRTSEINNN